MEPKTKHTIKDRTPYLHLVPRAEVHNYTIKKHDAELGDTIYFIKFILPLIAYQTEKLAEVINGANPYETCRAIFQWIYDHIEYRRDEPKKEQIRSPQRTIYDGYGDCDDMQVIACSLLINKKIPFKIRTTVYDELVGVQHIYPYALIANRPVYMDCVAQKFDYQVPYLRKIDYELPFINYKKMELQFLNGTPETRSSSIHNSIDTDDLLEGLTEDEIGELGKKGAIKAKIQNATKKVQNATKKVQSTVKKTVQTVKNSKAMQVVKKGVHAVNRVNPATVLLRTGILIGLKTNMFKIAENLRFTYLTPQQVVAQGLDPVKVDKLTRIREKLEKLFYGAGGLAANFKKEILTGKGNHDKKVPLAGLGSIDYNVYTRAYTPRQILGHETYESEIGSVEGFGDLGVAASAAVAAATGALSAIAALIKSIGDLRKKSVPAGAEKDNSGDNSTTDNNNSPTDNSSTDNGSNNTAQDNSSSGGSNTSNDQTSQDNFVTDPQSNDGGAVNKSTSKNKDTSAAIDPAEGSGTNSQSGNNSPSTGEGEGSDASAASGGGEEDNQSNANARTTGNSVAKSGPSSAGPFAAIGTWASQNKLLAGGIALVVVGGISYGLYKLFSGKGKSEQVHRQQSVAGLPKKKKRGFVPYSKFSVMKLK